VSVDLWHARELIKWVVKLTHCVLAVYCPHLQ
jgi:hypothetical protein